MAILNRCNGKSQVPKVHAKGQKRSIQSHPFWLLHVRRSTKRQAQNAFGIFNKVLQKSMTAAHQHFIQNFFNKFLKKTTQKLRTFIMVTKQQFTGSSDSAKNATNQVEKQSIILIGLSLLHRFICLCVRFILIKTHGEHGPAMPPIDDLLLLESATSIAEKIRTKKVSIRSNTV